jgi:hypothetical protein
MGYKFIAGAQATTLSLLTTEVVAPATTLSLLKEVVVVAAALLKLPLQRQRIMLGK